MRAREGAALTGFTAVLAITIAWWALALWPLDGAPAWLARTQAVCFGTQPNGLPDASGWLALVLQPAIMFTVLGLIAGDALARVIPGRVALGGLVLLVPVSLGAVSWRVSTAPRWDPGVPTGIADLPATYPRLDRPAPALGLIDQSGERMTLDRFRGRPVLITFAFAHCETVCPLVVQDVLRARDHLGEANPVALVVTLDPWRDVPSRLAAIARQWQLEGEAYVLSGSVPDVERVLDGWNVARTRDLSTGDVTHPRLVYVIDADGRIAYATSGGVEAIVELVRRTEKGERRTENFDR